MPASTFPSGGATFNREGRFAKPKGGANPLPRSEDASVNPSNGGIVQVNFGINFIQ